MSPPVFLVPELPSGDELTLDGPEGHHAAVVQRMRVGEALVLSDGAGGTASAVVTAVGRGTLDLSLSARSWTPRADPSLTVVQAIPKGDRAELAVATMTEVGVDTIVPWAAARSVARWKDDKPLARWRSTAREAAKQSRRSWLPSVEPLARTAEVVGRATFVLHESAEVALSQVTLPASGEIGLVVGPEGGVDDAELDAFVAAGGVPVKLGPEVLRTSTAGAAAVAALSVRLGRW